MFLYRNGILFGVTETFPRFFLQLLMEYWNCQEPKKIFHTALCTTQLLLLQYQRYLFVLLFEYRNYKKSIIVFSKYKVNFENLLTFPPIYFKKFLVKRSCHNICKIFKISISIIGIGVGIEILQETFPCEQKVLS